MTDKGRSQPPADRYTLRWPLRDTMRADTVFDEMGYLSIDDAIDRLQREIGRLVDNRELFVQSDADTKAVTAATASLVATVRAATVATATLQDLPLDRDSESPHFSVSDLLPLRLTDARVAAALGYTEITDGPGNELLGLDPHTPADGPVSIPHFTGHDGAALRAFEDLGPGWRLTRSAPGDWPAEYRWWIWLPREHGGDGTIFVGYSVALAVCNAVLAVARARRGTLR